MSVSQIQARVRPRLCSSSFLLAGMTAPILWVAVADLLRQGRLETVLSAGRGELAAPLLVALVVATGVCERIGRPNAVRSWPAATSRTRASWPCTPPW